MQRTGRRAAPGTVLRRGGPQGGRSRTARPPGLRSGRAATLGGLLTAAATAGTVLLALAGLRTWPGSGTVDPDAALVAVTLIAATGLLGWISLVLARATAGLIGSGWQDPAGPSRTLPWTVRWVSVALLALTAAPAASAAAGLPEPSWTAVTAEGAVPSEQEQEQDGHEDEGADDGQDAGGDETDAQDEHDEDGAEDDEGDGQAGPGPDEGDTAEPVPAPEDLLLPDGSPVPMPGWTPAPVTTTPTPSTLVGLVSGTPEDGGPEQVVVRRGDTLWDIAARHLGPDATVQDVAEQWPRWYAANRDLIGPDPDLILPGQELVAPGQEAVR